MRNTIICLECGFVLPNWEATIQHSKVHKTVNDKITPPKNQNILDDCFGRTEIRDINTKMKQEYLKLHESKHFSTELRGLKQLRRCSFKKGNLVDYTTLLQENFDSLDNMLTSRNYSDKKKLKVIRSHFTPIDFRLLENKTPKDLVSNPAPLTGDLIKELALVLENKQYMNVFNTEDFLQRILNIALSTHSLQYIFKREFATSVFASIKIKDTSIFYYLQSKKKEYSFWEMDDRLDWFIGSIQYRLINYITDLFKFYYVNFYGDNEIRLDFLDNINMGGYTNECKQLINNLKICVDRTKLYNMTSSIIKDHHSIVKSKTDILNLLKPDIPEEIEDEEWDISRLCFPTETDSHRLEKVLEYLNNTK